MSNYKQNHQEFQDTGRATDKPKGFVRWSLMAYWIAIVSLAGAYAKLAVDKATESKECGERVERVMIDKQNSIDAIRVEYQNKLEARMNRLENVEQRVDSLPTKLNQK